MKKINRLITAFICVMLAASNPFYSKAAAPVCGDMNADGNINVLDFILLKKKYLNGPSDSDDVRGAEDVDKNGMFTVSDILKLKKFIFNLETPDSSSSENQNSYPIDESVILEPKGTVHTGEGTFYGGGYVGGCAMLDPVSTDYWIVAMNLEDYADARLAGAYLEVTGELGTINMLVTDLLPEGKKGDLDLYVDAFPLIAPKEKGRVPVSWKIVPLDIADKVPVSYRFKEGSTEYWCGVQLLNHRYPIAKLEYLNSNGEFVEIKRRPYNYFESMEMGAGPFTFRATDIYGQVIVDYDIPLLLDEVIEGKSQFPV
ncbi:MAG: expansin EXLX1 family cellulose-binding protein [Oscillospiraceae bacterium]|nr:expansin EXLX1 family cellulose-binding protein [Oscillospiraceae bacterium]